jgi:RsiW-degrading membrane proteinase PrsW (M82 family)
MKRSHTLWKTGIFNILFQVLFLVVLYLAGRNVAMNLSGTREILFDVVIVLIPCSVWSFFFYLQDRVEPEPTQYVLASIFVGMALARLIGIPIEGDIGRVDTWLYTSTRSLILGSVFFVGTLHSALFYVGIRYGFYPSREFDEPVDGTVYGAFIGSGYAAVQSITYLLSHKGMTLFAIAYTATTNILIYASIAALIGLFVGKAKFGRRPPQLCLVAGFVLSSLLAGLYQYLTDFVLVRGSESGFFLSFILTLVFACVILVAVTAEMRKLTSEPVPQTQQHGNLRPDWLVFAVIGLFFAAGGMTRADARKGVEFRSEKYKVAFHYPHTLMPSSSGDFIRILDDNIFAEEKLGMPGDYKSQFALAVRTGGANLDALDPLSYIPAADRPLSTIQKEKTMAGGLPGLRLQYSRLHSPPGKWCPEIVIVCTDVVPKDGRTYIFSLRVSRQSYDADMPKYEALLRSVVWN